MIFCPVSGELGIDYWISQRFGGNAQRYAKYGLKGHNGYDIAIPVGTPVYAPLDGYISHGDEGRMGYGRYVTIVSDPLGPAQERRRVDLGHLSRFIAALNDGQFVHQGDLVGMSGGQPGQQGAGDSTGPHLHITYKKLRASGETLDKANGYKGAIDVSQWILEWNVERVLKRA